MIKKLIEFSRYPRYKKKEQLLRRLYSKINKRNFRNIGKRSIIKKPLLMYNTKYISIGEDVTIREGLRIEAINIWKDKKYNPSLVINNNVSIEQNCHITCANNVFIGNNVTVAAYSHITDIDHEYKDINKGILQQPLIVKETIIGDDSFIGMGSRIMPGVSIGKHCIIGANSVVNKDIPDYSVAVGVPARVVKRYNFNTKSWEKV